MNCACCKSLPLVERVGHLLDHVKAVGIDELEHLVQVAHESDVRDMDDPPQRFLDLYEEREIQTFDNDWYTGNEYEEGYSAAIRYVLTVLFEYLLQFIGHAVEKSMPVLVKHPIQAQLAAPFFTVVELFKLLRLREELFDEVQRRIALRRDQEASAS